MPIITYGIFLPNGLFLPNGANGHAKNAVKFCENFPELDSLRNNCYDNADEFLIESGCAIIAGYRGDSCIKVAKNNNEPFIKNLIQMYKNLGYQIWPYWEINSQYKTVMDNIINNIQPMTLAIFRKDV